MEPNDDPEARIRELERPLSDMARASELGTSQGLGYIPQTPPPVPPPMPAPYQGTYTPPRYTAPPRKASSGYRPWVVVLIAFGVFALAIMSVLGAIAGRMGTGGSGPHIFGDSTMTVSPGGQVSVSGVDENKQIACNQGSVTVSGVRNVVTIRGNCAKVTVSGVSNQITMDSADLISASGMTNQITYHSGEPKIDNAGTNNSVQQG
jgi:hypothetical protein